MDANTIYSKSILGMGELANRRLKLPQSLRNVLIMVDGTQTQQKLEEAVLKMGAPADSFQQLLSMGLIAPTEFGFTSPVQPIQPVQPSPEAPAPKPAHTWPAAQAGTTATFDLALTKRQLVKLVEKHLGPGAEQIALAIEACTTNSDFMKAAMKTKGILHNIKPASVNDPLWGVIGI